MINTLITAIKIALFVGFLAIMTSLVGLGAKIFGVPAPTMPTVPAFSFEFEAGGEYSNRQVEAGGSFALDFGGGSQTASQALSANSLGAPATKNVASKPKATNDGLANYMGGGRTWFNQKGIQLPIR